jgi:hypothetical protein
MTFRSRSSLAQATTTGTSLLVRRKSEMENREAKGNERVKETTNLPTASIKKL